MSSFLIPVESASGETRVAASPETLKKLIALGCHVSLERGAGSVAGFPDDAYKDLGVELFSPGDVDIWRNADVVLCVQAPLEECIARMKPQALLVGLLAPVGNEVLANSLKIGSLSALAMLARS